MKTLIDKIKTLDNKPVSKYNTLCGYYEKDGIKYNINRIFGGVIKCCEIIAEIPMESMFQYNYYYSDHTPICDYINRDIAANIYIINDDIKQSGGNNQKGFFISPQTNQRVLPKTGIVINNQKVYVTLYVKLPYNTSAYRGGNTMSMKTAEIQSNAQKRNKGIISSHALKILLINKLPKLVEDFVAQFDSEALKEAVLLYRNQNFIRQYIKNNGYVSFIADNSYLPRKGATDYKDFHNIVPFLSPSSLRISIDLPSGQTITGMGIKSGVTVITGDAYQGKTTLLEAIREGVYNHAKGDGREFVITDNSALTVKSEDGRSVKNTDISFFLRDTLSKQIDSAHFYSNNASGSTSQAAAVAEAFEAGSHLMLFDEDECANNFMYKDKRLQRFFKHKTTRPFIDIAKQIYNSYNISSIIIIGAFGDYINIADTALLVEEYTVTEITDKVAFNETDTEFNYSPVPRKANLTELRNLCLTKRVNVVDSNCISVGNQKIDVSIFISHTTKEQLGFACKFLHYLSVFGDFKCDSLVSMVDSIYRKIDMESIDVINKSVIKEIGNIEYVRKADILQLLYRINCVDYK